MLGIYMTFALMYLIFYICGYPLKVFFLRDDLRKFDLYITPWFGIGLVICALYPLSWLGFSVQSVAFYFFLAVLLASAASWLRYRERVHFARNDVIFLVSLALIAGAVYGFKLAQDPNLYAFGVNADYAAYLHFAKAVLVSSARHIATLPAGVPHINIIDWTLNFEVRGCVFAQAFVAALLDIDLAKGTYLLSMFILFLCVAAFRLFFRDFRYMSVAVPLVGFLLSNSFYAQFVYKVFMGQLFSVGFTIVAFFLEYYLSRRDKFDRAACVALVFVLTSCGMSYVNGLPIPLIPVLALPVALLFNKGLDRRSCVKNAAFAGAIFTLTNSWLIIIFIKTLAERNEMSGGLISYMPSFMDVMGLSKAAWSPDSFLALFLISNAAVMFILIQQLRREGLMSFISVSFALFLTTHLAVCLKYFEYDQLSSYYGLKSALSVSFIVHILMLRFFEERLNVIRSTRMNLSGTPFRLLASCAGTLTIFVAATILNVKSHQFYTKIYEKYSYGEDVTKSMDAIRELGSAPEFVDSDFIINMELPLASLAAGYFAPFERSYAAGYGGLPSGHRREMKDSFKQGDIYVVSRLFEQNFNTILGGLPLRMNDEFVIYRLAKKSVIQYDYEGLSHQFDRLLYRSGELIAKHVTDSSIKIIYQTLENVAVDISMEFQNVGESPSPKALAYLDDALVAESSEKGDGCIEIIIKNIVFKPGLNRVTVEFSGVDSKDMFLMGIKMGSAPAM